MTMHDPISPALAAFGKAIKDARTTRGWSLSALALDALGNPDRKGYVSQVERGSRKLSEGTIRNFARALDLPANVTDPLLGRTLPQSDETEAEDIAVPALLSELETLRTELKLSEALAVALAYKYAEGNPTDLKGALAGLEAAFDTAARERDRGALPSNLGEAVDRIIAEVNALNDAGDIDAADAAIQAELDRRMEERERQLAEDHRLLDTAIAQSVLSGNADAFAARQLQLIRLDAPSTEDQFHGLHSRAVELAQKGERTASQFPLRAALAAFVKCREIAPTRELQGWADNSRGNVLRNLGTRTGDPDTLRQAIDAYRAALEVRTREASELDWAMTQNNLGIALRNLGTRTGDPETLREAIEAYRAALEVRTREASEMQWAMTQNNLGAALTELGTRTGNPDTLQDAITAYRAALEVHTREASEMQWATTQNNLGAALQTLGDRTGNPVTLREAITAFRAALEVHTREASEMDWACTQNNLGNALGDLGTLTGDRDTLRQAIAAYRAALEVRTREASEMQWAMTHMNFAITSLGLAEHLPDLDAKTTLTEALTSIENALEIYTPDTAAAYHDQAIHIRDATRDALDARPS
ncbi:tetratricopeptide repeat protein [Rhodobacterales bacterium HKCCE4037]|nr:tetratricopeptide repeat protein [Rhodobacterales bacterium HKCCE4037]